MDHLPVGREVEQGCRGRTASERPVITDIGPQASRSRSASSQQGDRGLAVHVYWIKIMSVWCPFPKRRARSLHVVECELCVDDPLGLELVLQFVHLGMVAEIHKGQLLHGG